MNRLILLGNGFDLAHGMKTSYVDFIKWYITRCVKEAIKDDYQDALLRVSRNQNYPNEYLPAPDGIEQLVIDCFKHGFDLNRIGIPRPPEPLVWENAMIYPFSITPESNILKGILAECHLKRWVDVEAVFYSVLIGVLDSDHETLVKEQLLSDINTSMGELTELLGVYLSSIAEPLFDAKYTSILHDDIYADELEETLGETDIILLDHSGNPSQRGRPQQTLVVNFNYTSTIELYITNGYGDLEPNFALQYIHGKLGSSESPLVFGFGDEMDKRYQEMENEQAHGYFEHIKSFWYLKNSTYRELVRFVNSGYYQIVILGHSCGLSDRTMLHMLMEHLYCKSIKLYYHGTPESNNYTDTTYEIARHFDNKSTFRNRVVSKDKSSNMPQV